MNGSIFVITLGDVIGLIMAAVLLVVFGIAALCYWISEKFKKKGPKP